MKCDIISLDNKKAGEIELDDAVFGVDVRKDILARMVNWQLAKRRAGTHKVKTRGEISRHHQEACSARRAPAAPVKGGARATSSAAAVAFGPRPRDHAHDLPKKVRRLALKSALSAKKPTAS